MGIKFVSKILFRQIMPDADINFIRDNLAMAHTFKSISSTASMAHCRKANERLLHVFNHSKTGQDSGTKYVPFGKLFSELKKSIPKANQRFFKKVQFGYANPELHDLSSPAMKLEEIEEAIDLVRQNVSSLLDTKIDKSQFTSTNDTGLIIQNIVSNDLEFIRISNDNSPNELTLEQESVVDDVLHIVDAAEEIGVKFDPNQILKLGIAADLRGSPFAAEGYFRQAMELFREAGNNRGEGLAINNLALVYETRGDLEQAKIYFNKSLEISTLLDNKKDQGMILNNLGMIARDEGELEIAQKLVQRSLEIRKEIADKRGEGMCYTALGRIADTWGDWEMAERFFTTALEIYINVNDLHGQGLALANLGNAAKSMNKPEEAVKYYQRAKKIFSEGNHPRDLAITLSNLGYIACRREDLKDAEELHLKSLKLLRKIGYRTGETHPLIGLGLIHQLSDDYNRAEFYWQQALSVSRETSNRQAEAIILNNLAWLSIDRQEHVTAEGFLRESVRINNEIGIPLDQWYTDNGYVDPDAKWSFPPAKGDSEDPTRSK